MAQHLNGSSFAMDLSKQELFLVAQAAWEFRETGRFPSEALCAHRGIAARTTEGAETPASTAAWHAIAAALELTPTAYMALLTSDPEKVARILLRVRMGLPNKTVAVDE